MSEQIELMGITKLNDCLLRTGYLIPEITNNDKTPSWDGFIRLYENKDSNKKNTKFLARIPVQVKAETNQNILCEQISFNIKKTDIKNYLHDGGIIFFVIRIGNFDNYKIYYETLTPFKLKWHIKSMKNRKSINVKLKTFPKDNIEELTDIFFNFANDMKKYPSDKILSLNDFYKHHPDGFNSFTMQYRGIQYKKDPMDYFLNKEVTVYAKHSSMDILIPIDLVKINEYGQHVNSPVLIENVEYYHNFELSHTKEGIKVILGNSVSLLYLKDQEKANFNITIHGTLSNRINDIKFIISLLKFRYFTVGGDKPHSFKIDNFEEDIDFSKEFVNYERYLEYLLEIKRVMEILKVEDDLALDNITEEDKEYINILISAILYNNPQSLTVSYGKNDVKNIGAFRKNIKICNIIISILFVKRNDDKYELSNFFVDNHTVTYQMSVNEEPFNVSIYLSLTINDFITINNIDYDIIYKSFLKLKVNKELLEMTNQFVLTIIDAYDKTKKFILIETSLKLIDWILENECLYCEVTILNKIQIIKRMRTLSDFELSQLHNIITTSKDEKNLTGAYLLLGDIEMATYHFKKLSDTEQIDFKKYPINIFWGR